MQIYTFFRKNYLTDPVSGPSENDYLCPKRAKYDVAG